MVGVSALRRPGPSRTPLVHDLLDPVLAQGTVDADLVGPGRDLRLVAQDVVGLPAQIAGHVATSLPDPFDHTLRHPQCVHRQIGCDAPCPTLGPRVRCDTRPDAMDAARTSSNVLEDAADDRILDRATLSHHALPPLQQGSRPYQRGRTRRAWMPHALPERNVRRLPSARAAVRPGQNPGCSNAVAHYDRASGSGRGCAPRRSTASWSYEVQPARLCGTQPHLPTT